jgi:uncharacterized protein
MGNGEDYHIELLMIDGKMCNMWRVMKVMNLEKLIHFVGPFYANKDMMHDLGHIERMLKSARHLMKHYPEVTDVELITYGCYFHGFIYLSEDKIREYLREQDLVEERIDRIVTVSWESQKHEVPETLEGKIIHDAHLIEGGKTSDSKVFINRCCKRPNA